MKTSKCFLSTLVAAAAMTAYAYAATAITSSTTESWENDLSNYASVSNISEARALISGTPDYFINGNITKNITIGSSATTGMAITNANANTQEFSGSISGEGIFAVYFASTSGTTYKFSGDLSDFSGTMYVNCFETSRTNTLTFSGSSTSAISGTGTITSNRNVVYSTSGDVTVANSSITAANLTFEGGANYTVSGAITVTSSLTVSAGSLTFSDTALLNFNGEGTVSFSGLDTSTTGLQNVGTTTTYTLASGSGTISGLTTSNLKLNGVAASTISDDCKTATVSATSLVYNVASTTLTDISTVNNAIGDSSVAYINVEGTLDFGETDSAISKDIQGAGTIKIVSTASGHAVSITNADGFSGTVDFTGKLNTGSLTLGENATLKLSKSDTKGGSLWGNGTVACDVLFQTDYQIGDSSGTTMIFSGDVSGAENTTLTILSNSAATFNGSASFANLSSSGMTVFNGAVSGNLVASAQTIRFDAAGTHRTYTSNITLENSATLSIYDASGVSASSQGNYQFAFTGDIAVNGTNTLASNWGKEIAFQGGFSGAGSLTYTRATDGAINMNGRLIVDGNDKDFSGTITVSAANNNSLGIDLNASLENATIVLTGGQTSPAFMSIWKDVSVKRLEGSEKSEIGVGYASTSSMTGGNFKLTIGEGEFAGIIQDKSYQRGAGTSATLVTGGVLGIIKNTEGTLTLSGANTYTGDTTISAGTLIAANASALGTGNVSVESGATLSLGTDSVTVKNLSGAGTIGLATGTTAATLTVDSDADSTFSGVITTGAPNDDSLTISLVKTGTGTLTLSETSTNLSTVSIEAGSLVAGVVTLAYSDVSVASGARLSYAAGEVAMCAQSIEFASGATFVVDLAGVSLEAGADSITLDIIAASAIKFGDTQLGGTSTSTFALLTSSSASDEVTIPDGYVSFENADAFADYTQSWSYAGGTLSLTLAIPEPSLFGLLAGLGALTLVGTRRRRR